MIKILECYRNYVKYWICNYSIEEVREYYSNEMHDDKCINIRKRVYDLKMRAALWQGNRI